MGIMIPTCLSIVFWCSIGMATLTVCLAVCYAFYKINRDFNAIIKRIEQMTAEHLAIAERFRRQHRQLDQQQREREIRNDHK